MESLPGALPSESWLIAFLTSSDVGRASRVALIGTCGRFDMASELIEDGLFRTLQKCSAHRLRMSSGSVRTDEPSALRSGDEPEVEGP